ncbi:MAG TPA: hypothetical protein VIH99_08745 [Bdellovibrionota bacterium]|jgi:hypothetical protein
MIRFIPIFAVISLLSGFSENQAQARSSNACFSRDDVRLMYQKREAVSKAATACLQAYWDTHVRFYDKYHFSKYFGNRNRDLDTPKKRQKAILLQVAWPDLLTPEAMEQFNKEFDAPHPENSDGISGNDIRPDITDVEKFIQAHNPHLYRDYLAKKPSFNLERMSEAEPHTEKGTGGSNLRPNDKPLLQDISCVDMARRCLRAGFEAAGIKSIWDKVDREVLLNGVSGAEMQKALLDVGWRSLYWNPDPTQNAAWDLDDQKINPIPEHKDGVPDKVWMGTWGAHAMRWRSVNEKNLYTMGSEIPIPIDDKKLLVGFQDEPPKAFTDLPFFVGTAHAGYHVFPGFYGSIIEAHSVRKLSSRDNLEISKFNPGVGDKDGFGPQWTDIEKYRSGVLVVPPGYLTSRVPDFDRLPMTRGCVDLRPPLRR